MKSTMYRALCVGLVMVLAMALPALAGSFSALAGPGTEGDAQTSLVYDPATGSLSTDPPAGGALTSINIDSAGSMFIVGNADMSVLNGSFDNVAADNIFKATFGSNFGAVNFGNVLPSGLTCDAVIADLSAVGSLDGGGDLGAVDLVCEGGAAPGPGLPPGMIGDEQTSLVYDANNGELGVDAPASTNLTSINIDSAGLGFNVGNVDMGVFDGSFDNVAADNLFKATFGSSFGSTSFGVGVMEAGLAQDAVAADLSAVGSLFGGGDLGNVDLVYIAVPEPSALILVGLGLIGLLACRRR